MMEDRTHRTEGRLSGMPEPETGGAVHSVQMTNREQVLIQGVVAVENFDDEEVTIETELGTLVVRGEELHIKQLDLESGRFAVEGMINALQYSTPRHRAGRQQRRGSFLERLLK